jgi:hypothetical protein
VVDWIKESVCSMDAKQCMCTRSKVLYGQFHGVVRNIYFVIIVRDFVINVLQIENEKWKPHISEAVLNPSLGSLLLVHTHKGRQLTHQVVRDNKKNRGLETTATQTHMHVIESATVSFRLKGTREEGKHF